PELLAQGQLLNPDLIFVPIRSLREIPAEDASADFAMTFTVLQHLSDASCRAALREMKRLANGGHVLLVEATREDQLGRDLPHDETGTYRDRPVAWYQSEMAPWQLVRTWPRRIEPTAKNPVPGTAMLFASEADC